MPTLELSKYERVFPAGHVLFEQGEIGTRMYVIRKGRVRIFRVVDGEEVLLAVLGAGEFFGEMALLEDKPRNASARAESAVLVIEIDEPTFEDMIRQNSEIAVRMLRKLSARVRELDARIQRLTADRGIGRALEIVREIAKTGTTPRRKLVDTLTQDASIERYEAELIVHDLVKADVLDVDGDDVRVVDAARLEDFARYLELRQKYEGAGEETSDAAAPRIGRLLRALDKSEEEEEHAQTVLARHFKEYLDMKARFS